MFRPIIAAALLLPAPALAQSLDATHDVIWQPSGKVPAVIHRVRDRPRCLAAQGHHQAGKTPLRPSSDCRIAARPAPERQARGGYADPGALAD
jgi:hypothetical protein